MRTDGTFEATNTYYYNASLNGSSHWEGVTTGGTYMGGAVTAVVTVNKKNGTDSAAADTRLVHQQDWGDGLVLVHSTNDSDTGSPSNPLWETSYTRNAAGVLTSAYIDDGRARTVTLVNDAEGRVLQRDENDIYTGADPGTGDPRQLHYYFNGRRVGDISNNGTSNTDYATSIGRHVAPPISTNGAFDNGATGGTAWADFDQSYDPINGLTYEATASSYTVQGGETLGIIAQQ